MSAPKDGGPAFPCSRIEVTERDDSGFPVKAESVPHAGMTLRDYFAAKAVTVFRLTEEEAAAITAGIVEPDHGKVAKFCYGLADAMLKAREAKQ